MGIFTPIEKWSSTHHPRWLVFLRAALGLCLFIKGISFLQDSLSLQRLVEGINFGEYTWLPMVITWVHLLGGAFIAVGLFTRLSCLVQIPILLGAIFLVHLKNADPYFSGSDLGFSVIVLLLLIVFFVEGGGRLSLDNYFKKALGSRV